MPHFVAANNFKPRCHDCEWANRGVVDAGPARSFRRMLRAALTLTLGEKAHGSKREP